MEDRNYILDKMSSRIMTVDEFNYDRLWAPPLYSLLTPDDIEQLHRIATSIRYTGKPMQKLQMIDDIMKRRGFRRLGGGTNRMAYKFLEDDRFIIKVATSAVALNDSPREMINQQAIEPFCAKCFEVSPCGTVGLFERVIPITSREEFLSVADMAYDLISNILTGEYVMDDIGTEYFMNYGVRKGFGLVILDYVYRYKLDGNKLYCNNILPDGSHCGGVIDYDDGYNHLRCTKCGRVYKALELQEAINTSKIIKQGGKSRMKVSIKCEETGSVIHTDTEKYLDTAPRLVPRKKGKKATIGTLKVSVDGGDPIDVKESETLVEDTNVHARGMVVHSPAIEEKKEEKSTKLANLDELYGKIEGMSYTDDDDDEDDEYEDDDEDEEDVEVEYVDSDQKYEICYADMCEAADITDDEDDLFKAIYITDEEENVLCNSEGVPLLITRLMDKDLDELVILDKEAYTNLLDELETLRDELSSYRKKKDESKKEDNLPYYYDSDGNKRWKTNHNLYTRDDDEDDRIPVEVASTTPGIVSRSGNVNKDMLEAMEDSMVDDGRPAKKSSKKKKR